MSQIFVEIEQQLERWYEAVHSGDADRVTLLYAADAVLLSTLGVGVEHGHAQIRRYFADKFLPRHPVGKTITPFTRILGGVAVNSGVYEFILDKKKEQPTDPTVREKVTARYTFVYHWTGNDWVIVEHHSSVMPEEKPVKKSSSPGPVKPPSKKRK